MNTSGWYPGLPEPQNDDYTGVGAGRLRVPAPVVMPIRAAMPAPRRNSNEPRLLPMSIVHTNSSNSNNVSSSGVARQQPGHVSSQTLPGHNSGAHRPYPEIQSDTTGRSAPLMVANPAHGLYAGVIWSAGYGQGRPMQGEVARDGNNAYTSYEEAGVSSG